MIGRQDKEIEFISRMRLLILYRQLRDRANLFIAIALVLGWIGGTASVFILQGLVGAFGL